MLQAGRYPDVDMPFAVRQIEGRQKMKHKVPLFYDTEGLLYPARLSLEQASSQLTACYKADLCHGRTFADLTGGLGIDCYFISRRFEEATYVERQAELCDVARHNFTALEAGNVRVLQGRAEDVLRNMEPVDCLYLDPARRSEGGRKLVLLSNCEPDVAALAGLLLEKAACTLVKLSPMLDVAAAVRQLPGTHEAHILAVDNECKEVLLMLRPDATPSGLLVRTANLSSKGHEAQHFDFRPQEEAAAQARYTDQAGRYLYEPNAAVMKSGAYRLVSQRFNLPKLHPNTHLYTSDRLLPDFPGRTFEVVARWGHDKKAWRTRLAALGGRANVAVRNYPLSAPELKKKLKLTDGGGLYLFACTLHGGDKAILECKRI